MPVTAMTYFLPTAVPYRSSRKNLRRFLRPVAVPLTGPRVETACDITVDGTPTTLESRTFESGFTAWITLRSTYTLHVCQPSAPAPWARPRFPENDRCHH